MKIHKIKIHGFKSVYDDLELDFDNIKGMWWLKGPVGSGKTTISEAIIYGLFGAVGGKNNAGLVSWGRKKGSVQLWCTSKGHSIFIERTLKTQGQCPIYVEIDGQALNFTDKRNAQSILETEYYDVSELAVEMMCIISFNNFKSMSTMNQRDTKRFLDNILGFSVLSEYAEISKEFKKDCDRQLVNTNSNIRSLRDQIQRLNKMQQVDVVPGDISVIINEINELRENVKRLDSDQELWEKDYHRRCSEINANINTVKILGVNKKKEIDFIKKGICPTCGAPIDQSHLAIKEQEREVLLSQYKQLNNDLSVIQQEYNQQRAEYNNKRDPIAKELSQKNNLKVRLEEQEKRVAINQDEITGLQKELSTQKDSQDILLKDSSEWQMLIDNLLVDARNKILQVFIPILNKNINKYASRLRLPYTITFGDDFECSLNMYGLDHPVPVWSLSVGQLRVVDMVIILGVINTIISAHNMNILFLDELFSNLDYDLRSEMCEILRENLDGQNTILITSHQDIDTKWLDGTISVELTPGENFEKHSTFTIEQK